MDSWAQLAGAAILRSIAVAPLIIPNPSSLPKPDLQIDYFTLDSNNEIILAFSNQGSAVVPANTGRLQLFVDHVQVGDYALGELFDQSFRSVGGQTILNTTVRVSRSSRRVLAIIDPLREIDEEDELQNTMSSQLDAVPTNGFDLELDASVISTNRLRVTLSNRGNLPNPPFFAGFRVWQNGMLTNRFGYVLPAIAPGGGSYSITLPLWILSPTPVKVEFQPQSTLLNNSDPEIDNSNNLFEATLSYVSPESIEALYLSNPVIRSQMNWEGSIDYLGYDCWPTSMKTQLKANLLLLERGQRLALDGPPTILETVGTFLPPFGWVYIQNPCFSAEDAKKIFLAWVAHSLWFDRHHSCATPLASMAANQRKLFLDSRFIVPRIAVNGLYSFNADDSDATNGAMNSASPWNPQILYDFLKQARILKETRQDTVVGITDWARAHLRHHLPDDPDDGYLGNSLPESLPFPAPGNDHVSFSGCHSTSGFLCSMIRAANVPARYGFTLASAHGRLEIPGLVFIGGSQPGVGLGHSDDVYNSLLLPFGESYVETRDLFYSFSELSQTIDPPLDLDCNYSLPLNCNNEEEQSSFNNQLRTRNLAIQTLAGGLLYRYALYGDEEMDEFLTGNFARPFCPPSERTQIIGEIHNKIVQLGDGDYDSGRDRVVQQHSLFAHRKAPTIIAPAGENRAPRFNQNPAQGFVLTDMSLPANMWIQFSYRAEDPDGDNLVYGARDLPAGSYLLPNPNGPGRLFRWHIGNQQGVHKIVFLVRDGQGGTSEQTVVIRVY